MTNKEAVEILQRLIRQFRKANEVVKISEAKKRELKELAEPTFSASGLVSLDDSIINDGLIHEAPFAIIQLLINDKEEECEY